MQFGLLNMFSISTWELPALNHTTINWLPLASQTRREVVGHTVGCLSHVVQSAETANGRASERSRYIPNRNPFLPFSHVITVAHLMIFSVQRQGHGTVFDWLQWGLNSGSCMTGRSGFCTGMWLVVLMRVSLAVRIRSIEVYDIFRVGTYIALLLGILTI
jgi:hypothetical protein